MASRLPSKPPPKPARPSDQSSFQKADPRKGELAKHLDTDIAAGVGMDTLGGHEAEGLFSPGALLRHTGSHAVPADLSEPAEPPRPVKPAPKPAAKAAPKPAAKPASKPPKPTKP